MQKKRKMENGKWKIKMQNAKFELTIVSYPALLIIYNQALSIINHSIFNF
jgi:hypothetical protein